MIARPMWCDDFDMDFPKIFSDAPAALGELADIELWTNGHATDGVLNHPSAWNTDFGLAAFFGFNGNGRGEFFYTSAPLVKCTAWEMFRDAWPHHVAIVVEREMIWDTGALSREFDVIAWAVRQWRVVPASELDLAKKTVRRSWKTAIHRFRDVYERNKGRARKFVA